MDEQKTNPGRADFVVRRVTAVRCVDGRIEEDVVYDHCALDERGRGYVLFVADDPQVSTQGD